MIEITNIQEYVTMRASRIRWWPFRTLLSFVLLAPIILHAQSIEQWTTWGDASMAKGEYYGASRYYAGALDLEPGRMLLQWKQAEACRLSHQYDHAADLYDRVYRKDMGRTYPEALRWLGEMQLCDARYTDAQGTWNKVLQKEKDKNSTIAQRAQHALAGIALADAVATDSVELAHLPAPVNTFDSEFGGRPGPEGTLWFSSLRGELNNEFEVVDTTSYRIGIYRSTQQKGTWQDPVREPFPDGTGAQHANPFWAEDGRRLFFTLLLAEGTSHIAVRDTNGSVAPLTGSGEGTRDTQPSHAHLNDREVVLFASDRDGGFGGMDIWVGDLAENTLSNIRNAGAKVNTAGDEICPYYDANDRTLWYSSDFQPGLGGFDIFKSSFVNDEFGAPVNALQPFNSPANDLYPTFHGTTGEGWLTSNRKGSFAAKGETCCNDIYHVRSTRARDPALANSTRDTAPDTSYTTLDEVAHAALVQLRSDFPLKLYFHNDEPEPRTRKLTTAQAYEQTLVAYRTLFPDYLRRAADTTTIARFFATEVEGGWLKLNALVNALQPALAAGQQVTLDVRGHASPLAKNDYNRDLSLRRIESLRNELKWADGGALNAYLDSSATNGGVLRIRVLPFGEERSMQGVSDDVNDLSRSVYSVEAARERRIEVERLTIVDQKAKRRGWTFDLGTVHQGGPHPFVVPMTNTGQTPLRILKTRTSCECVLVQHVPDVIPAGATVDLELFFSGRARPGPLERTITLETDGTPPLLELTIHGTVIDQ